MISPQLGYGGAESAFLRLAEYFSKNCNVTVALMASDYGDGPYSSEGSHSELPIVLLDDASATSFFPIIKIVKWWRMLRRLQGLKKSHDVAISFQSGANLLNALAGQAHKTIVSERGSRKSDSDVRKLRRFVWSRLLLPLTYLRAKYVVAASEGLAYEIVASNAWARSRVVAIEGTVKSNQLVDAASLPVEPALGRFSEYETVVAFGRMHVQKGYDFLLEVFARVRAIRPRARLLLIGDGPETTRLHAIAASLGLRCAEGDGDPDVIFVGMQSEPLRYTRLGRVFAFPSRSEGLPNALIEALAAGIPVLASDCPWGPRSILSEGSLGYGKSDPPLPHHFPHGVLMPLPEAPDALATWVREINRMLDTPRPRPDRAERLRLVSRYDIESTGPVWLALARELAATGRGVPG